MPELSEAEKYAYRAEGLPIPGEEGPTPRKGKDAPLSGLDEFFANLSMPDIPGVRQAGQVADALSTPVRSFASGIGQLVSDYAPSADELLYPVGGVEGVRRGAGLAKEAVGTLGAYPKNLNPQTGVYEGMGNVFSDIGGAGKGALDTSVSALEGLANFPVPNVPEIIGDKAIQFGESMRGEPMSPNRESFTTLRTLAKPVRAMGEMGQETLTAPFPESPKSKLIGGAKTVAEILGVGSALGGELGAQTIEAGPAFGGLALAGKLGKASGAFAFLGEQVPNALKYQGGFQKESKAAHDIMYRAKVQAKAAEQEVLELMRTPSVAKEAKDVQAARMDLRAALMEQTPENRAAFRAYAANPVELAPPPIQYNPEAMGYTKAWDNAEHKWQKLITPTDADVAEEMAQKFGKTKNDMVKLNMIDPDFTARHNEFNYAAVDYAGPYQSVWQGASTKKVGKPGLHYRKELQEELRMKYGKVSPEIAQAKRLVEQKNAIATAQYYQDLSRIPGMVVPEQGKRLAVGETMMIGDVEYTKVGGNLGAISDKLVRTPEAKDIIETMKFYGNSGNTTGELIMKGIGDLMSTWKFGKIIADIKPQTANIFSNATMAHAEGLSPFNMRVYRDALGSLIKRDETYSDLRKAGAPWLQNQGMQSREVYDLYKNTVKSDNIFLGGIHHLKQFATENYVSQKAAQAYQFNEAFFKHSVALKLLEDGVPITDAIARADAAILNYDKMPILVKQARTLALPFISFSYGVTPKITQIMIERPQFLYQYKLFANAWNNTMRVQLGIQDEDFNQMMDMYPGTMPMIMGRDAKGKPHVHDVGRFTMVNDFGSLLSPVTGFSPGSRTQKTRGGSLIDFASDIANRNPAVSTMSGLLSGTDARTGVPFANMATTQGELARQSRISTGANPAPVQSNMQQAAIDLAGSDRMQFLASQALPNMLGGRGSQELYSALTGGTDFMGQPKPVSEAITSMIFGQGRNMSQDKLITMIKYAKSSGEGPSAIEKMIKEALGKQGSAGEVKRIMDKYVRGK